jgi:hypothetical protein
MDHLHDTHLCAHECGHLKDDGSIRLPGNFTGFQVDSVVAPPDPDHLSIPLMWNLEVNAAIQLVGFSRYDIGGSGMVTLLRRQARRRRKGPTYVI